MPRRYTGGFLSATEQATDANSANGIYTLQEAGSLTAAGNFPVGRSAVTKSLRLRASASGYLTKTPVYPGDQRTWTWSGWVKYSGYDNGVYNATLFGAINASFGTSLIAFSQTQNSPVYQLQVYNADSVLRTKHLFRDPSAWTHLVVVVDNTQPISNNRTKIYINGVRVSSFESEAYPSQNAQGTVNSVGEHSIGKQPGQSRYYDGYISEYNFIDGQALTPSAFGMTDAATGAWIPKKYSGTYGTNGFYLPFNQDVTSYSIDALIVAGGGGGGSFIAGGGGGGGTRGLNFTVLSGSTYSITVGAGGAVGYTGSNSLIGSNICAGGGSGGGYETDGANGGSGGGSGGTSGSPARAFSGGGTLYSQGSAGGNTPQTAVVGGAGGGGAGGSGTSSSSGNGANGGAGTTWSVNSVTYAGGGGGGCRAYNSGTGGNGGSGGGGNGGGTNHAPSAGSTNLGGGGGGHGFMDGQSAAAGGSGVVIIRIPDTQSCTFSGGVTYSGGSASGGYKTYTVTATSTTSETVTFS